MARVSSKETSKTNAKSKIVKSIPNTDRTMVTCFTKPNESGDKYHITHYPMKEQFTLWKCVEDGFEKIATSNNPMNFDDIIPYEK